ncbi:HAMP domain-containing histidine kinase [Allorhizobium sp. BGMRC 0089]|uniref:sensor histidine kinase n=1 Tax=Allorhizobium sonneratiae TaxID=2934936 RepID=UPI002033B000|nr:HAMP domain-containing sensor histidine kinase [Allorhizobium sonneratiae]MCM2291507.1 HAMP domain-containing histidine kinase [Allorhizobium sonneratiae]
MSVVFVLTAEVLIFGPSIGTMRLNWLQDHINKAAAAAVVIDDLQPRELPKQVQSDALLATDTKAIALTKDGTTRLLAMGTMPQAVDGQYDLTNVNSITAMKDAFETLLFGGNRLISVSSPVGDTQMQVEVVMSDAPLHRVLLAYADRIALVSLVISAVAGLLLFVILNRILIKPIRRLADNIQEFADNPEDPARVIATDPGRDELAFVRRHLASMQAQLQKTLRQQKNLADLGLAVSKINHDMRNILASAQLMSDRLVDVDDPLVKSFAPKLVRTIDRAVSYTSEVLSYGQASEAEPRRRRFPLASLVQDMKDMLVLEDGISFIDQVPQDIEIDADSDQLFRVIHNLCRNAAQALSGYITEEEGGMGLITLSAHRLGNAVAIIVDDNGPGMARKARENLFTAFRGSARSGGTGLGLAIAREIVLAHGGTIALVEKPGSGTQFRIEIPDRPVTLEIVRSQTSPEGGQNRSVKKPS